MINCQLTTKTVHGSWRYRTINVNHFPVGPCTEHWRIALNSERHQIEELLFLAIYFWSEHQQISADFSFFYIGWTKSDFSKRHRCIQITHAKVIWYISVEYISVQANNIFHLLVLEYVNIGFSRGSYRNYGIWR